MREGERPGRRQAKMEIVKKKKAEKNIIRVSFSLESSKREHTIKGRFIVTMYAYVKRADSKNRARKWWFILIWWST